MAREQLPNRRLAETFDFEISGLRYTCTIGCYADGRLAEIFLQNTKAGSQSDGNARESAIALADIAPSHRARSVVSISLNIVRPSTAIRTPAKVFGFALLASTISLHVVALAAMFRKSNTAHCRT